MASQRNKQSGVTLLELMVAISISGIVIGLAMFSWTFISQHTTMQKRKSLFYSQTEAIAAGIANTVRTSSQILSYSANTITCIDKNHGDTVTFEMNGDSLRKNMIAIPCLAEGARFSKFTIEEKTIPIETSSGVLSDEQKQPDVLLVLTLGMEDRTGMTCIVPMQIKVKKPLDHIENAAAGIWNF